jgi:hypothetical protein
VGRAGDMEYTRGNVVQDGGAVGGWSSFCSRLMMIQLRFDVDMIFILLYHAMR